MAGAGTDSMEFDGGLNMGRTPSPELRERWLAATRLPGVEDARESCLLELSEYTEEHREVVEQRCERAVDEQRDLWYERARDDEASLTDFYNGCDAYVYELLWWHALQQGDAPVWNARILDIARQFQSKRYLDFGGGIGTNGILIGREGIDVTIADISDVLQKCARWRLARREIPAQFIDLKTTPLVEGAYDLISAVDVLEHVADPLETLRTLHGALAPGGVLVFDLIASKPDPERPFHLLRSKFPIRSTVRGLGFRHVESFQKYEVYQRIVRSPLSRSFVRTWDVTRWRLYYLAQGEWPRSRVRSQK